MPKLDNYKIGAGGVNVDSNDIHIKDDELRASQNWTWDPAGSAGGIRKRDGIAKFNSSAMAGAVRGFLGLPKTDRSGLTTWLYAPYDDDGAGGNTWHRSNDGTTWASVTTGAKHQQRKDFGTLGELLTAGAAIGPTCLTIDNVIYHAGRADGAPPTVNRFDGTTDVVLATIPDDPAITPSGQGITCIKPFDSNRLVISTRDNTTQSRVFMFDLTTYQMTMVAVPVAGIVVTLIVWNGAIWTSDSPISTVADIIWARPEDTAWNTDLTLGSTEGTVPGMAVFKGDLYVSSSSGTSASALIRRRTPDGTWTTVYTQSGPASSNSIGPLFVNRAGTAIWAYTNSAGAGTPVQIYKSTTGLAASWSSVHTPASAGSTCGVPYEHPSNGKIYWIVMGATHAQNAEIIEDDAGTFSQVEDTEFLRGPMTTLLL